MDLKDKIKNFNKRWNITENESPQESFNKFKIRILNILSNIDRQITRESVGLFCQLYGIPEEWESINFGEIKRSKNIINRLNKENNEIEFYKLLEVIFTLHIPGLSGYGGGNIYSKNSLYREVCQAIDFSNINLATTIVDEEIIFYPKGEKVLDEELVDNIFSFLNKESNEHFIQALKDYQTKKYIKSAESLRRSLEEFLRYKLKNGKGLDANIKELQTKLKADGRDLQIRNIIGSVFNFLDQYFNDNSKHNDGDIDDSENEFLIYQAGLLMRYINNNVQN